MYKIILNNIEMNIPEDLFNFLKENLANFGFEPLEIGDEAIIIPAWCSICYINSMLKAILDLISSYVSSILLKNNPETSPIIELCILKINYHLYAYNLYQEHKEYLPGHMHLLDAIKTYTEYINAALGKGR